MKGKITDKAKGITMLHRWDKNGSHEAAIKKAVDRLAELKAQYKKLLLGKSYEDWKTFSKKLSACKTKLKASVNKKDKWQTEINNLKFV